MMHLPKKPSHLLALLVLICVSGCSSFNRSWKAASTVPANGMQGRWDGSWLSERNGHHGRLRCLMTTQADGKYQARFHAIFWKIFRAGYTVPLTVVSSNGVYQFQGDANLGWWGGGAYHYEGQATGTNFFSTYRSKADHGTFQMKRPLPEGNAVSSRN
jgi:hypothetical protein